jgi:ribosomal-protein-alanine N-acetyltransferase
MVYRFDPMDEASARAIFQWRYGPPYEVYNLDSADLEDELQLFLDPAHAYHRITDEGGNLVAYCCFGAEAQVPGGDYGQEALDVGMGVRPDLTGQGRGLGFVGAVLDFAAGMFAPAMYRVTVAQFNQRALRVWEKAGFRPVQTFARSGDGMSFVILARPVQHRREE